jgi:hypothetical protein
MVFSSQYAIATREKEKNKIQAHESKFLFIGLTPFEKIVHYVSMIVRGFFRACPARICNLVRRKVKLFKRGKGRGFGTVNRRAEKSGLDNPVRA